MTDTCVGVEDKGKTYINGWFRNTLLGFSGFTVMVLTIITTNVIANDKDSRARDVELRELVANNRISIVEMKSVEQELKSINKNLDEINGVLIRTAPYERVLNNTKGGSHGIR
jgi:hypothetical protein